MVMSAITVRANMRMLFDEGSANKMQSKYMARLSSLEKAASSKTNKINKNLIAQHKQLTLSLQAENKAADKALENSKKQITEKVKNQAKQAMQALKPPKSLMKTDKARYEKEYRLYKQTLDKMKMANEKFAKSAKALGAKARMGGTFSNATFMQNEAAMRKKLIALQQQEVVSLKKGTAERKAAGIILNQMIGSHKMLSAEEEKNANIKRKNNALIRQSQMLTNKGIMQNNRLYKEQMALLGRINGALTSISMQMSGAFMGAIMASGIALMTFMFRLQSLISTFQEFEKELMNAQSIFQTTNDVLFSLSDEIVNFGTQYGISLTTASEGLYTLASAGLSASDSQEVLANTLKLSMAVQGDHDTIAKLTTQTIFGFGLEMEESAALTDKFAHAINMSLIEYQDLASAVKFAMPFFVSTGQNIDQLLGSLQVLTNRALEAGIAGRGLRQALAEFAQHAEDNTAAFRKMGVEIMNTDGSFKLLTEIAREFSEAMGPAASDVDLMTTLLEDLNVRGATAFVHLVQNVDEFEGAVGDLSNSAGSATRMAEIQQKSLANQIQVIKNALMAPFLLSDEVGRANGTMNTFGQQLHDIAAEFESFFVVRAEDGTAALTDMGIAMRDVVLQAVVELSDMIRELLVTFSNMNGEGRGLSGMLHALMIPLRLVIKGINLLGENGLQALMMFKVMNSVLPITQAHTIANTFATLAAANAETTHAVASDIKTKQLIVVSNTTKMSTMSTIAMTAAQLGSNAAMFAGIMLINKTSQAYKGLGYILLAVAGAMMAYNIAKASGVEALKGGAGLLTAMVTGALTMAAFGAIMKSAMKPPPLDLPADATVPMADTGLRMYDMGGKASLGGRHFPVMVEPGETIVSKSKNMLGEGGITLNIQGDIVTNDADDFAERISQALPEALRRQNDIGGI